MVHVTLELKCVVDTNLIRVSYRCISCYFQFKIPFKQLYASSKIECASVIKVGVVCIGVHVSRCLKEELA